MRNDRMAVYMAETLPLMDALGVEYAMGTGSLAAGAVAGARAFADGAGRHGAAAVVPPPAAAAPASRYHRSSRDDDNDDDDDDDGGRIVVPTSPVRGKAAGAPGAGAPMMTATAAVALSLAASPFGPGAAGGMARANGSSK